VRCPIAAGIPFVVVLSLEAQTTSARIVMGESSGVPIVSISVNGAGPYPFVLDTGANVTVIKRKLLQSLSIHWDAPVTITSSLGDISQQATGATTLDLGGLSVDHIAVNTLDEGQLGALEGHVFGILGEDFLKHFDLLIDNDHHVLTRDHGTDLAHSVEGEHLPLRNAGSYHASATRDRIVIPLRVDLLSGRPRREGYGRQCITSPSHRHSSGV
jgi:hypothetical protein